MFKKNKVVEVDSKYFYYKMDKEDEESIIPLDRIKYVDIKKRNIYILVKGEQILIKKFTLPKVRDKYILEQMIERELVYYFKDIADMCYSYSIYGESKNTFEIMIFCLNCNGISKIKDIALKNNLRAVWIIQNTFLEYFHNNIIHKEFIFMCNYENNLYLIACENNCIASTKTLRLSLNKMNLKYVLEGFLKECHEKNLHMNDINVYVANVETEALEPLHERYTCIDLGVIHKEEFKAYMERRLKI